MRKILKMNKNNEPLISVIVPVYNGADRLSVCLKSISRQTYKNFEMIIIDDGSTDDTLAICKCWASLDKRLHVYHQKNMGPSAARNFGIAESQGEYIYFVDSDDWLNPNLLQEMIKCSLDTDSQIVFTRYNLISANTGEEISNKRKIPYPYEDVTSNVEALKLLIPDRLPSFTWSFLSRRSLFFIPERINFPDYKIMEDQAILYQLVSRASRVGFIHKKLYNYVVREDSLVGSLLESFEMFRSCVSIADERQKYMDCHHPELHDLTVNANIAFYVIAYKLLIKKTFSFADSEKWKKIIKKKLKYYKKELGFSGFSKKNQIDYLIIMCNLTPALIEIAKFIHRKKKIVR